MSQHATAAVSARTPGERTTLRSYSAGMPDYLIVEEALPRITLTLNRPQQLNPLSTGLMQELTATLKGSPTATTRARS